MSVISKLSSFFCRFGVNPSSILVGVSGGADSVALIHLLRNHQKELQIGRLGVAHVNHGLRGAESDGDEEFVRGIAERAGVEFYRVSLCGDGGGADIPASGVEDWARRRRYEFFQSVAKEHGFAHIATAHTANDQAETALMRLMRGTGVRGLRGVLPVRRDGVIRPLLDVERKELLDWLKVRGLGFREDSSNSDDGYRRNFVRNRIIPLMLEVNSGAVSNIAAGASNALRAWDIISDRVGEWIKTYVLRVNEDVFHVEKAGLADKLIAPEAMLSLFEDYGISPSKLHIERVFGTLDTSFGEHLLPDGWRFYPRDDRVCFLRLLP